MEQAAVLPADQHQQRRARDSRGIERPHAVAEAWRSPQQRRLAVFCVVWLGSYALLFVAWQPTTIVYRITDLIPLLLLGTLLAARRGRPGLAALAGWAVLAAGANLKNEILPNADPSRST